MSRKWFLVTSTFKTVVHLRHSSASDIGRKFFHEFINEMTFSKQECIPVGCVPSATVAVCWGVSAPGGCLVWRGLLQGVPGLGGLPQGVPGPGGVCSGEVVVVSQHALSQIPPVNRMTDRCKDITFATLLQTVTTEFNLMVCKFTNL